VADEDDSGPALERATAAAPGDHLEIGLEHTRWRHFAWAVFGLAAGSMLIWKMGTVAQWLGAILIVLAAWAAWGFARTLIFEAGAIVVDDRRVVLPRGVCRGRPVEVERAAVRHAYLLRRAVPWTRAAPVLVIETADSAFTFPRDWFATEADQRRIIHALAQVRYGEVRQDADAARPPRPPRLRI